MLPAPAVFNGFRNPECRKTSRLVRPVHGAADEGGGFQGRMSALSWRRKGAADMIRCGGDAGKKREFLRTG